MGKLEAQLEQTEKEKRAYSQEATQLRAELAELNVTWAELQDVVTVATECESASMKKIKNLEARLHSKMEEAIADAEKMERMKERLQRVMEKKCEHANTNTDLCRAYDILWVDNDRLQSKIKKLQAKLQDQDDSYLLSKTHAVYHMKRKTLEDVR